MTSAPAPASFRGLQSWQLAYGGDCKIVGNGVTELREHFGPGYRVYVTQLDTVLVVALGGGDKSSQQKDIDRATELALILKTAKPKKGNVP